MKYAKLRGAIREKLGTEANLAKKLNLNAITLSKKLNGKADWKKSEIEKTLEFLYIPRSEVYEYFFVEESQKAIITYQEVQNERITDFPE